MQLHLPAKHKKEYFSRVSDEAAHLVERCRAYVDQDRRHHFSDKSRGRIEVRVALRFRLWLLARASDAAAARRGRRCHLAPAAHQFLKIDAEALREADQLVVGEAHFAILELR